MQTPTHIARVLLGLVFFVFGLNGFLNFLPQPPHEGAAAAFLGALAATGYMFPLIKATEVIAGAMLLSNRFVPLALLLLAPIVVNIAAFNVALAGSGYGLVVAIVALGGFLAWRYRSAWQGVLAVRARPVDVAEPRQIGRAAPAA